MNDDLRRIYEMLAAINTRLEVNERSTRQIDQQLALLNLKREAELNDFRAAMKNLTDAIDELKRLHADNSTFNQALHDLESSVTEKISEDLRAIRDTFQSTADAVESIQVSIAAMSDNSALVKAVDELKNAARNTVKAEDFVTIRMALQNSSVSINDVKKRVDGLKFDTTKRFNELSVNSDINHQSIMKALAELKTETAPPDSATPEQDFEVSKWWNGDKER